MCIISEFLKMNNNFIKNTLIVVVFKNSNNKRNCLGAGFLAWPRGLKVLRHEVGEGERKKIVGEGKKEVRTLGIEGPEAIHWGAQSLNESHGFPV